MYVKTLSGIVVQYPYTAASLPADYPSISFPAVIDDGTLAEYGVFKVEPTVPPTYDAITQNLTEAYPESAQNVWSQVWVVTDASPEEVAKRQQALLDDLKINRAIAYREEADPLFFKAERGEGTRAEWEAKVAEIRARYPYPTE